MAGEKGVRVVGGKNPLPKWERFARLQRNANAVAGGIHEPKGVHRFKTFEEFNAWKMKCQVRRAHPPTATS
jgi:hypothetical protein